MAKLSLAIENLLFLIIPEDAWYRAVCLISQPNTKIQLLLIDDGRYVFVWHTHIRIMIEEFSHYVATALICTPKGEIEVV